MPLDQVGVHGTPTIALLDTKGVVQKTWVGLLTPASEADILATLSRVCPTCGLSGDT